MGKSLDSRLLTLQSKPSQSLLLLVFQIRLNMVSSRQVSNAFYTVDHTILLNKINQYGIKNKYYDFFKCYLNNRKQFISYGEENTYLETVKCCFPLGSIIGRLFFLIFLKDLQYAASMLNPVMFAEAQVFFTLMVT